MTIFLTSCQKVGNYTRFKSSTIDWGQRNMQNSTWGCIKILIFEHCNNSISTTDTNSKFYTAHIERWNYLINFDAGLQKGISSIVLAPSTLVDSQVWVPNPKSANHLCPRAKRFLTGFFL